MLTVNKCVVVSRDDGEVEVDGWLVIASDVD
jgi:hypothetical protein